MIKMLILKKKVKNPKIKDKNYINIFITNLYSYAIIITCKY